MIVTNTKELVALRKSGQILRNALKELCAIAKEGMTGAELDLAAEKIIRDAGAEPTFLNYSPEGAPYPYPAALCVSINDEVVHGIPSEEKVLKQGDIISLDLGVTYEGMITDAARTVVIGEKISEEQTGLLKGTEEALKEAANLVRVGIHVGDIGAAISEIAKKYKLGVVRELGGHGIGKGQRLHDEPYIANFSTPGKGAILQEGMIIALEPIFTLGSPDVTLDADKYTYRTRDHSLAAHFEDTFLVTKNGAEILTR